MTNFLKNQWNKIVAIVAVPTAFAAGTQFNGPAEVFDDKGLDSVRVQVLIQEPNYKDALYYTPEEWPTKTPAEILAEKEKRIKDWNDFVKDKSKKVMSPEDEQILEN